MPSIPEVIRKIEYLHALHRLCIHRGISEGGLHFGQPPILDYIASHENCTQRELCDFLRLSPPSVATSVKRLQRAGFLEKNSDDCDLRRTNLRLTDSGREAVRVCDATIERVEGKLTRGFSPQELQICCDFLGRMIENLADGDLQNADILPFPEQTEVPIK